MSGDQREVRFPAPLRKSNIELLRIVAMIIIVAHHFSVHGGFQYAKDIISINKMWILLIQIGGKIGVDVFVLISGYFLILSDSVKTKKLAKLWFQLFFYSVAFFCLFAIFGHNSISVNSLLKCLAPVTFSHWWFASSYFVLYLLSPYINRLLSSFTRVQYTTFLLVLCVIWCLIPTFTNQLFQSNNLLWFIFVYAIGGYLQKYGFRTSLSGAKLISLSVLCAGLTYASAIVFTIIGRIIPFFGAHPTAFYDMQAFPTLLTSILLFFGFSKLDIPNNKLINTVSSATSGVYLVHEDDLVRSFLWDRQFHVAAYSDSNLLIPYSLLVIILVFVGCTLVELFRKRFLERPALPLIDAISAAIDEKIKSLQNWLSHRLETSADMSKPHQ